MKIEKQVTTLKQSGILDEFGIKNKDAQYYWVAFSTQSGQEFVLCRPASHIEEHSREWAWFMVGEHSEEIQAEIDEDTVNADGMIYAAFTAAELIKMNAGNGGIDIGCTKESKGKFYMQTDGFGEVNKPVFTYYNSFAQASAAKLINALQNEWLDVETCNSRLAE